MQNAETVLQEADETLNYSGKISEALEGCVSKDPACNFSMAPPHAEELSRYLGAHRQKLEGWRDQTRERLKSGNLSDSYLHLLATRRFEVEDAFRFVEGAFIEPRRGRDSQALEAADWMCVAGFKRLIDRSDLKPEDHPVGPIVALDSERSPAVWNEDAELRIPSLFATSTAVKRGAGGDERTLAAFPVICLPNSLVRLPHFYPLLSHEVGHTVDNALEVSQQILERLDGCSHLKYWRAWMREIVADAIGMALSGEAFALSLWRFVQRRSLNNQLSTGNAYPPTVLRAVFLRLIIETYAPAGSAVAAILPGDEILEHLPGDALELKTEFQSALMPLLSEWLHLEADDWRAEQERVREAASAHVGEQKSAVDLDFRLIPSVLTLATLSEKNLDTYQTFRKWHGEFKDPPEWVKGKTQWDFQERYIPNLRPTLLGNDGRTKVPPTVLLVTHRKIAFVGATQKFLLKKLEEAIDLRDGVPWESIDLFFASDELLEHVDRFDKSGKRIETAALIKERNDDVDALRELCAANTGMIGSSRFLSFGGSTLFASFWDWDEPGGRIHVSSQLFGIDIGKCPSTDLLWIHDTPTVAYQSYCQHLENLYKKSTPIPNRVE